MGWFADWWRDEQLVALLAGRHPVRRRLRSFLYALRVAVTPGWHTVRGRCLVCAHPLPSRLADHRCPDEVAGR